MNQTFDGVSAACRRRNTADPAYSFGDFPRTCSFTWYDVEDNSSLVATPAQVPWTGLSGQEAIGNRNTKALPSPSLLVTSRDPSLSSTSRFTFVRPRPVPYSFVVKNGSKI